MTSNEKAFLDMIAWSELGRAILEQSDNGYDVLVGSLPGRVRFFHSYADHPRQLIRINAGLTSSAAGRYQILRGTFDHYKEVLRLPDFSPASQDNIALRIIRERRAIDLVRSGAIPEAISRCKKIWASFPGSGYDQHEHSNEDLLAAFTSAGGTIS